MTDSGGNLNKALLEEGLVDEISLIINPTLVDGHHLKLFRNLNLASRPIQLELHKAEKLGNELLVLYKVVK